MQNQSEQENTILDYELEKEIIRKKTAKPLMLVGIASMVMLFGALLSSYILNMARAGWVSYEIPSIFYVSTVVIILSSLSLGLAQRAIKQNKLNAVKGFLGLTALLGLSFLALQWMGKIALEDMGYELLKVISTSNFSLLVGGHFVHVAGGLIASFVVFYKAVKNKYSSTEHLGIDVFAIYWHFLGVLWIILLLFLIFIR